MTATALHRIFGAIAVAVLGTAIVWGFLVVGSPVSQRLRKFDERRIADLQTIRQAIQQLCVGWEQQKRKLTHPLPKSLDELADLAAREPTFGPRPMNLVDPRTGEKYGYMVTGESTYDLCATFELPEHDRADAFWNHPGGRHCFSFDALSAR